ncbi:MAG: hypothetical protein CO189_11790 [candidate division Zixibacteria bacterium CG_4_9_14_3_um_filter_46_8]|nr:MAG: hypothetical protein CO189_11790 [candidate division Zixibacteria bacterium CG_4_9_14_3_um_filter_46_8]
MNKMRNTFGWLWSIIFLVISGMTFLSIDAFAGHNPSYSEKIEGSYLPFFPDGVYDQTTPKPDDIIGYPLGQKAVRYEPTVEYLQALDKASPMAELREYGVTHEGRKMYYLIVSSAENLARLDNIKASLGKLADPRKISGKGEADRIIEETPVAAWMAYSIHGDELSGTDASLQLAYQLAAGIDDLTKKIRDNVVVLIDPSENPDGRERFLSMMQAYGSKTPNYDKNSVQHNGVWPQGRTNHYLFDLNRDYILMTQPETQGRVGAWLEWNPQLVVDAHEMWADATYLFSPPRQPINYNTPENVLKWYQLFRRDQGDAFDKYGWSYYSGDWNEQWYPGYGSAWPTYSGAVGILYEQAGVQGESVLQKDDYLLTYHESVHHQFTSSMANLKTAAENRKALLADYYDARVKIMEAGRKGNVRFLFAADGDEEKMNKFLKTLIMQGIEVEVTEQEFEAGDLHGIFEQDIKTKKFPKGTYMVSLAQPTGALAKAILDFDSRLKLEYLKEERRELEKNKDSQLYEVTSWSLPIAFGIDAYWTDKSLKVQSSPLQDVIESKGGLINPKAGYGYLINHVGEKTSRLLARMFAEGLTIYVGVKPFTVDGIEYGRGSLLVRNQNNPQNLSEILGSMATQYGVVIHGVNSARAERGPDLGSTQFKLLKAPYVALCTGTPLEWGDFGSLWHLIDIELGIPHSLIGFAELNWADIDKYNVLIIPSVWGGAGTAMGMLGKHGASRLRQWMEDGGTLICTGSSAAFAADSASGLSQVSLLTQAYDKIPMYEKMLEFEQRAELPPVDTMALWHPEKAKPETKPQVSPPPSESKFTEKLDMWKRMFRPRGALLRVNLDVEKWPAFGIADKVAAMVGIDDVFLAGYPVTTVGRFGDANSLRVSGLLWPEARERLAKSAYMTRESVGNGQLILFAESPYIRAYCHATRGLFVNTLLYGPGLGGGYQHPDAQR